ncbi:HAD-like domain-containing protein, partial [Favolaschia claudopus]
MVGRYFWVVLQPSPTLSVRYLGSPFADEAAQSLECGKYLALFTPDHAHDSTLAFLVQPASDPLPDTYLPISPYKIGPRESLEPGFDWPFGDCVINTGRIFSIVDLHNESDNGTTRYELKEEHVHTFLKIAREDIAKQDGLDGERWSANKKAEREAAGFLDDASVWTAFSPKSTYVPPKPYQFFSPDSVDALYSYDIGSLKHVVSASLCFEDKLAITRLRSRFSRISTDRTIMWTMNQAALQDLDSTAEQTIADPPSRIIDLQITINRPDSPESRSSESSEEEEEEYTEEEIQPLLDGPIERTLQPPAPYDIHGLQVIYFEIFGTLIDSECGIYEALQPLLAQCPYQFERWEALTFYFESEVAVKQRMPTAPYSKILAAAHGDMADRLGLVAADDLAFTFASSIATWPLFNEALSCVSSLAALVPFLVALPDIDKETLDKSAAFAAIAPHFSRVYTWDGSRVYKPEVAAFQLPLKFYKDMGIPLKQQCLVSNSIFRDLEPARELGLPAIWIRYPQSLAGNIPSFEGSFPVSVCTYLVDLDLLIRYHKGARSSTPPNGNAAPV